MSSPQRDTYPKYSEEIGSHSSDWYRGHCVTVTTYLY